MDSVIMRQLLITLLIAGFLVTRCTSEQEIRIWKNDDSVRISNGEGVLVIEPKEDRIIRIRRGANNDVKFRESLMVTENREKFTEWTVKETEDEVTVKTDALQVIYDIRSGNITFFHENGTKILA